MKSFDWRTVPEDERWLWWERVWQDVCELRVRYELPVRFGWWEHAPQLEALAALAAWTGAYDDGEWDDPPGKLSLLLDLERIGELLRDGNEPFYPDRHRHLFARHLQQIGCAPPAVDSSTDAASPNLYTRRLQAGPQSDPEAIRDQNTTDAS